MNLEIRSTRFPVALATLALIATSCGGSTESAASATLAPADTELPTSEAPAATELATDPTTTLVPETTDPPATTAATATTPTTTVAAASTAAPRPASSDLTLRPTAIGGLAFGAATTDQLLDVLTPVLGNATSIEPFEYPDKQGSYYENTFEERGFTFPFGNDICFGNGLCTYFGGDAADALRLVGYRQSESAGSLATASGVTAGSRGADFGGVIVAEAGGCYSTGGGNADGVDLYMRSGGEPFGYFDEVTNDYVVQTPDLADLTVLSVYAGEAPFFLYDDC